MSMVGDVTNYIKEYDPEVGGALEQELGRQRRNLELIASENIVSPAVMLAMGTVPTNKYAEGYPGKRYYGGCEYVDVIENLAIERGKATVWMRTCLCSATLRGKRQHCGLSGVPETGGYGDGTESGPRRTPDARLAGEYFRDFVPFVPYSINEEGFLDYTRYLRVLECKPKMIVAGASAYPREIRLTGLRDIAKEVGAILFGRYGAYCRTGCGRTSSEPGSICGCGDHDHAQDTQRTKRRTR